MTEQWLPVVGWEGSYEVSDQGRVRSLLRKNVRILRPAAANHRAGHLYVMLCRNSGRRLRPVHGLVLEAFVGPRPEGHEGCHRDGIPSNNNVDNLYWGTRSQNMRDAVAHGTHNWSKRTQCKYGHEYTPENTHVTPTGARVCRECRRRSGREHSKRKWAKYKAERVDFVDRRHEKKPYCQSGRHLWSEQTPVVNPKTGKRHCRLCKNERRRKGPKTHCKRGHEFTPENTYFRKNDGGRQCKECTRLAGQKRSRRTASYWLEDMEAGAIGGHR